MNNTPFWRWVGTGMIEICFPDLFSSSFLLSFRLPLVPNAFQSDQDACYREGWGSKRHHVNDKLNSWKMQGIDALGVMVTGVSSKGTEKGPVAVTKDGTLPHHTTAKR